MDDSVTDQQEVQMETDSGSVVSEMSPEKKRACREAFSLFDKNKDGTIDPEELADVVKALGMNPSETDVRDLINDVDVNACREAFLLFDKNNDGVIEPDELADVARALGMNPSDTDVRDLINDVDVNQNGMVEFDEFCKMLTTKSELKDLDKQEELMAAFRVFDTDNNGYINSAEFRTAMQTMGEKLSEEDVDIMIDHCDLDKDGRLNYSEFVRAMTSDI